MTAEQLRNSILQEAISGRLVPQDPNDEPASVVSHVSEDEVPIELPATWKWVQMQDVLEFVNGRAYKKEELLSQGKYRVLRVGNFFTNQNWYYSDLELPEDKYCYKGDLLYAWSASFGPRIWEGDKTIFHYHIWNVKYDKDILFREYLYYFFLYDKSQVKKSTTGSTMIHVSMENMKPRLLPLPPLAEQKRIVAKLEELLPIVEQYGKAQTELDELNAALPARLRQSILQEAISGRLIPQDPNEDAEDVKTIEIEDAPFEIPNNWRWCSLGDLVDIVSGTSYKKDDVRTKGVRILRGGNIVNDELILAEDDVFLPDEYANLEKNIRKDDIIIVASTGSQKVIGKPALIRQNYDKTQIGAFLRIIRAKDVKYVPFLWLIFKGMYYREHIRNLVKGTNINNIKEEYITTLPIPLPPLAEQKRIVAKLEELFAEIDKLK